jgi:hypothetical protein
MLDRTDSPATPRPLAAAPAALPAWARAANQPESDAEAAYLAGAALARLDATLRKNPPWAGVFRRRLALSAAAASVLRAGRAEDEAGLRDALHLTRPGADPGPVGKHLLAWRELSARSAEHWRQSFAAAAEVLRVPHDEALRQAIDAAEAGDGGGRPAPFAAAQVFSLARRALTPNAGGQSLGGRGGEGELLAAWLADAVLARRLNWPFALPLLAAALFSGVGRRAGGLDDPADGGEGAVVFAYAKGAACACDLSAVLGRRAQMLFEAAPKLRAKGAGAALGALLDEDSLSAATKFSGLSERGSRRLFDRLVALGAIRELTGRATFRLYGL